MRRTAAGTAWSRKGASGTRISMACATSSPRCRSTGSTRRALRRVTLSAKSSLAASLVEFGSDMCYCNMLMPRVVCVCMSTLVAGNSPPPRHSSEARFPCLALGYNSDQGALMVAFDMVAESRLFAHCVESWSIMRGEDVIKTVCALRWAYCAKSHGQRATTSQHERVRPLGCGEHLDRPPRS
ncbi:hypothetical protein H310_07412 [Aphanomyces invadans]|uniref:Uncharacterized protein n=1 Tax=Aphanomyces invadans TaxID=157072 RepID=A0A024U2Z7_9STRA|nr:hypothetical protein H310_07412 [Aphanomyces invadans]ETV99957.1 hypothetical protein H310_07412 [Aphanomyces invadans]|eukprot:XP_008871375.1 hypothetical protein H310_07412 [Aphanomyces invadans]